MIFSCAFMPNCAGILPLFYIEFVSSVLMFILGIVLFIGINYVSSTEAVCF